MEALYTYLFIHYFYVFYSLQYSFLISTFSVLCTVVNSFNGYMTRMFVSICMYKTPVTPFQANLAGKLRGTIFAARSPRRKSRACQYVTRISPGLTHKCARKSDLHAQNFVGVSARICTQMSSQNTSRRPVKAAAYSYLTR